MRMSRAWPPLRPVLRQHTDEVLRPLGIDMARYAWLRALDDSPACRAASSELIGPIFGAEPQVERGPACRTEANTSTGLRIDTKVAARRLPRRSSCGSASAATFILRFGVCRDVDLAVRRPHSD
ncbi:hypothetical protein GCM10023198_01870 [Promicromonospora umidemergens]|uniref:Uncharacterized protein n=1 Tax=Promicromonospora umidemergens TaxID=629679 RepID=A0ABP8WG03_9MICO